MNPIPFIILLLATSTSQHPVPEEQEPETTPTSTDTTSTSTEDYSPPSIIVVGEDTAASSQNEEETDKHKRHRPTPSPEELEERRKLFIKALGGGGGDDEEGGGGGGQIAASIQGLGSLATDVVSLIGSNANETFAPLREARQRARENFPDFGTQLNRVLKNGREYATRAYKGLAKNARVKLTNVLRFMLSAVTRLASTIGGMYRVIVSLLDVATRGAGTAARVGSRLLQVGSNATVFALARGTGALRSLAESGDLVKPVNQAVMVGRELAKGVSEDLFDKVEWAQEGLNSKIELVQSLAPNFLLRAHESTSPSSTSSDSEYGPPSDSLGGYSKLTSDNDDVSALLSLASTAAELMSKRNVEGMMTKSTTSTDKSSSDSSSTTTESPPPDEGPSQALLNDIFGLQDDISEVKMNSSTTTESSTAKS